MKDLEPPFCMEEHFPPFAYLDRPIDEKVEGSPTWSMACALLYVQEQEQVPEYVRLCVLASTGTKLDWRELDCYIGEWNCLVQYGAVERYGTAAVTLREAMLWSVNRGEPTKEQHETLDEGLKLLKKRRPGGTQFVER